MDDNKANMLMNASQQQASHWDQWMGGSVFVLGDDTTRDQYGDVMEEFRLVKAAKSDAADILEKADARETEVGGRLKKLVLKYPDAVSVKKGADSDEMAHCPHLSDQRKTRHHSGTGATGTTGGTTEGLPADVQ